MTHLQICLLGPFQVVRSGRVITEFETTKTRALLAYLAAEADRSHRREALAEMLWPDRPEGTARANLRHTLANLRAVISDHSQSANCTQPGGCDAEPPFLLITRKAIQFNIASDAWVDVAEFETQAARGVQTGCPNVEQLKVALKLYRGSFLEDLSLGDSAAFGEWTLLKREQLSRQVSSVLNRLAEWYARMGEYDRALEYARQRVDMEPWDEERQRQVMRLLALAGQRSAALAQYEACRQVLQEELGVEPEEKTTTLYERIRDGKELPASSPLILHNLPAPVTPFIGREAELAKIGNLLREPTCRLVSLIGPGGSGKTRLALEAAADILSDAQLGYCEQGVYFVSLAPLRSVDDIVPTVAQAIGFSFHEGGEPRQQLLDYLCQKHMLLVMDNFEHLLDGVDLVTDVLKTAPAVKILATSRAKLNLQGEHLFPVGGMDLPLLLSFEYEEQCGAVELFSASARRAEPDFDLTTDNVKDVVRVCRLVEGMPLPILLAAAWTRLFTPGEIADQIEGSIDFLATEGRDVPARQRSMRATLDHSWHLLTARERAVMQALSVFRGGFTRQAAQGVAAASPQELMALVDKSLLHRAPTGRYEIHELLRQYAEERLDHSPNGGEKTRDRHCGYYVAALHKWGTDLKCSRGLAALTEMDMEVENVRAAWGWAAKQVQVMRLDRAMEGICLFYDWRARLQEGEAACHLAAEALRRSVSLDDGLEVSVQDSLGDRLAIGESLRIWAKVLVWQGHFNEGIGRPEIAAQQLRQGLAILERPELVDQDTRWERAFILAQMGGTMLVVHDYERQRRLLEESLALYRALDDQWWISNVLERLGKLAQQTGTYREARQLYEESLAIRQTLDFKLGLFSLLMESGRLASAQGQLEEGERLCRESLALAQEIGTHFHIAHGLLHLGEVCTHLGKFAEGHAMMEESRQLYNNLAPHITVRYVNPWLCETKVHLGQYEQARAGGQESLALSLKYDYRYHSGFCHFVLGLAALGVQMYADARSLLEKSVAAFQGIEYREKMSWALSVLGYAERGLGQSDLARQYLVEALRTAMEIGAFVSLMYGLPAVALLLADTGEKERAVEVYALASRYGFVANSCWFEDVAGRHIAEVAATLPPEVVAAAQERGRTRDMDATAKELLVEFAT